MNKILYIFDCPVHGEENSLFCFRAFDLKNLHLWHKYHVVYEAVDWPEGEKVAHLEGLHKRAQLSNIWPDL